MAFSYTAGSTADRDRVRLEIGDTDSSRALFSDAELDDLLVQESGVLAASARACEILSVRFARDYDFSADGSSFRKSSVAQMYATMAHRLRARARGTTVIMPRRKDGYSDDVNSDEATVTGTNTDFERGRFSTTTGRL